MNRYELTRVIKETVATIKRMLVYTFVFTLLALMLAAAFAVGSTSPDTVQDSNETAEQIDMDGISGTVTKFTDTDSGATCYLYEGEDVRGISCVSEGQDA